MRSLRACARAGARLQRGAAVRSAVASLRLPPDPVSPRGAGDWRSAHGGGSFARSALPLGAPDFEDCRTPAGTCRERRPTAGADASRCMSAAAAPPPAEPVPSEAPADAAREALPASEQSPTQYVGPLAVTLRRVKLLSLSSLLVTTVGAPLLVYLNAPEGVSELAKVTLSGTVVLFGCFTTALLSWFAAPYVLQLNLNSDDTATITTLDVLARPQTVTIRLDEMREPRTLRPLATFESRGRVFFVDGNIADSALLLRMGLQKKENEPITYDSDDDDEETTGSTKKEAK